MTTPHDAALEAAGQEFEKLWSHHDYNNEEPAIRAAIKAYLATLLSDPRTREAMVDAYKVEILLDDCRKVMSESSPKELKSFPDEEAFDAAIAALQRIAGVE